MKRFYKIVSYQNQNGGYAILLDGKPVKTPGRKNLMCGSQVLADALIAEWAAQKDVVIPESMPLTQIETTRIDRVAVERKTMVDMLLKYVDTDLLCYHAPEPPELVKKQNSLWGAALDDFSKYSQLTIKTTTDLHAIKQEWDIHQYFQTFIENLSDEHFTIFQVIAGLSGSLILAHAFIQMKMNAHDVYNCARVEEIYKGKLYREDFYGPDPAQDKKDQAMLRDLEACARYLNLLAQG